MLGKLIRALRDHKGMFRSGLFWSAQSFILVVAVADELLDVAAYPIDVYFIPIGLFWVPLTLMTFSYGLAGSLAASFWIIIVSLPNWLMWHVGAGRFEEIVMTLIAVLTAVFMGNQVDQKVAAQKRAQAYSAYSVHNQEEVLRRISLDIHDESLQALMAICHRIDIMRGAYPSVPELGDIRKDVEQVTRELRGIIGNLRPVILEDLGVVPAIRQLVVGMTARTRIGHDLKVSGEDYRLPAEVEMQIFRIAQEALRNVERHSGASSVTVGITFAAGEVRLDITDDGVGFDATHLRDNLGTSGHHGIMGMLERAELVQGKLEIDSEIGARTRVTAHIPAA